MMEKGCDTCEHKGISRLEKPCNKCYANKYWEPRLKNAGIKLKPCPFCGGEVKLIDTGDYAGFCISCEECDSLFAIERIGATEDDLIKIWERRAVSE